MKKRRALLHFSGHFHNSSRRRKWSWRVVVTGRLKEETLRKLAYLVGSEEEVKFARFCVHGKARYEESSDLMGAELVLGLACAVVVGYRASVASSSTNTSTVAAQAHVFGAGRRLGNNLAANSAATVPEPELALVSIHLSRSQSKSQLNLARSTSRGRLSSSSSSSLSSLFSLLSALELDE